ncbi:RluA family pseudouridine synthase [Spiroplasma endosymbiont of Agriotes lineatus]|uniref:RluA family pseudouridine synthase n=1 Tax=Spiroplasma endosymbiont of Agriotes lineatus TaxID=3077930 RepID=UPI0030D387E7
MEKKLVIIVEEVPSIKRIDKYLQLKFSAIKGLSRSQIQKLITNEKVIVNNQIITNNYNVKQNNVITVNFQEDKSRQGENLDKKDLDIVYEDEYLLVINKPKNLVVHPGVGNWDNTLVNILLAKDIKLSDNDVVRPGIVHRLDKNTTGLLIIAKCNYVHQKLTNQLQNKSLTRKYFALVRGIINKESGFIDSPIGRNPKNRKRMAIVFKNSKPAQTKFNVIKRFLESNITFLECELLTGRTHQIRVHLSFIKHPVLGDHLYGIKQDLDEHYEQYLHAHEITFIHPISGKKMKLNCELPESFKTRLDILQ